MDVRRKRLKVTFFYMALISIFVVSVSVLVYNLINRELVGVNSPVEAILEWVPFYEPERIRGVRAAVLQSSQTADFLAGLAPDSATAEKARRSYLDIAQFWQRFLSQKKIRSHIITDQDLLNDLGRYNLLVLPAAHCLSEEQILAIKAFLANHRGVIMTHIAGNRDATGRERDWSLTADLTGGRIFYLGPAEDEKLGRNLFFAADNVISANLPAGFPLRVRTHDQPISLMLQEKRMRSAAAWESSGGELPRELRNQTGMAYGEYLGGRFVWLGFTAHSVPAIPELWEAFDLILSNAISWAGRRTVVGKACWPGTRGAATISIMARRDLPLAQGLQRLLADRNITPGLFVGTGEISLDRVALEQLRGSTEIAPEIDLPPEQVAREVDTALVQTVQAARREMSQELVIDVQGFSLPVKPKDNLERFSRLGFDFIWLASEFNAPPKLAPAGHRPLFGRAPHPPILLSQSARSDRVLIEDQKITDPATLGDAMVSDFESLSQLGALYTISIHPHLLGSPTYSSTAAAWLEAINSGSVWISSPKDIADWVRKYEGIRISVNEDGRRITFMISNEGNQTVPEIRLFLYPGHLPESLTIRAERMRTPIPEYRFDLENNRIEFTITNMRRRENRTYYVDF